MQFLATDLDWAYRAELDGYGRQVGQVKTNHAIPRKTGQRMLDTSDVARWGKVAVTGPRYNSITVVAELGDGTTCRVFVSRSPKEFQNWWRRESKTHAIRAGRMSDPAVAIWWANQPS